MTRTPLAAVAVAACVTMGGSQAQGIAAALTTAAVDLGPPGFDEQFGAGRVNAFASLQAMSAP